MVSKEDEEKQAWVMAWYGLATFSSACALFGIRRLLLRDASNSRISKAADYVPVVEVRMLWFIFLLFLSRSVVVLLIYAATRVL